MRSTNLINLAQEIQNKLSYNIGPDYMEFGGSLIGKLLLNEELNYINGVNNKSNSSFNDLIDLVVNTNYSEDLRFWYGPAGTYWGLTCITLNTMHSLILSRKIKELDELILSRLNTIDMPGLVDGISGLLIYAIKRNPILNNDILSTALIERAIEICRSAQMSNCIRSPPKENRDSRMRHDLGVDLGLAHGYPALIAIFADCLSKYPQNNKLREALQESLVWLKSHELPQSNISRYPFFQNEIISSRLGWCYGDLSVAIAFCKGGRILDDKTSLSWGRKLFDDITVCGEKRIRNNEHCLCHGYSGVMRAIKFAEEILTDFSSSGSYALLCTKTTDACRKFLDGHISVSEDNLLEGYSGTALGLLNTVAVSRTGWHKAFAM